MAELSGTLQVFYTSCLNRTGAARENLGEPQLQADASYGVACASNHKILERERIGLRWILLAAAHGPRGPQASFPNFRLGTILPFVGSKPTLAQIRLSRRIGMLKWAIIFFIVSVVAGLLGFSGISAASAGIAKVLFFVALAIFLLFLVLAFMAGSIAF